MTAEEYFGDWIKVIDKNELIKIMRWLKTVDSSVLCPSKKNIFKAFQVCPYEKLNTIVLSMDPYPQEGIATGIAFGNSVDTPEEMLSPSLKVIKEAVINYELPHSNIEFDNSLESWARQGVLMLNSALTCEVGKVGQHLSIWRPFMQKLIKNISDSDSNIVFVLFGRQAQELRHFINDKIHHVIEEFHPAYYARRGEKMPYEVFTDINRYLKDYRDTQIKYYNEND